MFEGHQTRIVVWMLPLDCRINSNYPTIPNLHKNNPTSNDDGWWGCFQFGQIVLLKTASF
jgi:hypothetical protein